MPSQSSTILNFKTLQDELWTGRANCGVATEVKLSAGQRHNAMFRRVDGDPSSLFSCHFIIG